ncbi:hypothetical protein BN903_87 [Halorubrum sp. AJ67]|nr:hypothetical protein BN903_87 [Halorubrum sp. AJ67]
MKPRAYECYPHGDTSVSTPGNVRLYRYATTPKTVATANETDRVLGSGEVS